jgi:hypothetical protein
MPLNLLNSLFGSSEQPESKALASNEGRINPVSRQEVRPSPDARLAQLEPNGTGKSPASPVLISRRLGMSLRVPSMLRSKLSSRFERIDGRADGAEDEQAVRAEMKRELQGSMEDLTQRGLVIGDKRPSPGDRRPTVWCSERFLRRFGVLVPDQGTLLAADEGEVRALFQGYFDSRPAAGGADEKAALKDPGRHAGPSANMAELRAVAIRVGAVVLSSKPGAVFRDMLVVWPGEGPGGAFKARVPGKREDLSFKDASGLEEGLNQAKPRMPPGRPFKALPEADSAPPASKE